jgi:hypothetical protein
MEYTIRFAFKRDGDIVAPPFVTYASPDAPVGDIYRDAVSAALARCTPLHFSDGMAEAVAGRGWRSIALSARVISSEMKL